MVDENRSIARIPKAVMPDTSFFSVYPPSCGSAGNHVENERAKRNASRPRAQGASGLTVRSDRESTNIRPTSVRTVGPKRSLLTDRFKPLSARSARTDVANIVLCPGRRGSCPYPAPVARASDYAAIPSFAVAPAVRSGRTGSDDPGPSSSEGLERSGNSRVSSANGGTGNPLDRRSSRSFF